MAASLKHRSGAWLVALTPAAAFLLLYACGSFGSSAPDATDGGIDPSNADIGAPDVLALDDASHPADATLEDADADADADAHADAGSCVYVRSGSNSSGSMCSEDYMCPDGGRKLECQCGVSCACGDGRTIAPFACAGLCTIAAQQRTACDFPAAGGSSGASSAGGGGGG